MVKSAIYLISSIIAVPLSVATAVWFLDDDLDKQFEDIRMQTSIESLEKGWGLPDRRIKKGEVIYYIYNADILNWGQYIFIFRDGQLDSKAIDD